MENNQLPDERDLPGFADVIAAYSKQLNQLGYDSNHIANEQLTLQLYMYKIIYKNNKN